MATRNSWNIPDLTTNGQVLIGSGSVRPSAATIIAGTNVTVTNSAGGIKLSTAPINDWVIIQRDTASNTAFIDYLCPMADYQYVVLIGNNSMPANNNVGLGLQVSTDGGVSFDTTEANYEGLGWSVDESGTRTNINDSSTPGAKLQIYGTANATAGPGANRICSFIIKVFQPANAEFTKSISYAYYNALDDGNVFSKLYHIHKSATAVNALRLKQTTGNITQGDFILYGAKA